MNYSDNKLITDFGTKISTISKVVHLIYLFMVIYGFQEINRCTSSNAYPSIFILSYGLLVITYSFISRFSEKQRESCWPKSGLTDTERSEMAMT